MYQNQLWTPGAIAARVHKDRRTDARFIVAKVEEVFSLRGQEFLSSRGLPERPRLARAVSAYLIFRDTERWFDSIGSLIGGMGATEAQLGTQHLILHVEKARSDYTKVPLSQARYDHKPKLLVAVDSVRGAYLKNANS